MGETKYIREVRQFFRKSPVVSLRSIKNIISSKGGNKDYAYILINHLLKTSEIKRITKGFYTTLDDPTLAVFCFKPAYLGLQDALSIHGLWEQETNPVIITTKQIRQGVRNIMESNVEIKRIEKKYFFGVNHVQYEELSIPVSNIEKTFFDLIYFKQAISKDLLKEFKKRINTTRIKNYAEKYPKQVKEKVFKMLGI